MESNQTDALLFIDVALPMGDDQANKPPENKQPVATVKNDRQQSLEEDGLLLIQQRRIKCMECQRFTCENEEKMLRHMRKVHRGENPFQCYMCDYSTYNKSVFEEHVRVHQGIKPFKCSHCPYRSASKKNTKKHEQIHRPTNPNRCSDCGFIARNKRALTCHRQSTHDNPNITEKNPEQPTHKCPKCEKIYADQVSYLNHRKSRRRCKVCAVIFCPQLIRKHMLREHEVPVAKRRNVVAKNKTDLFSCQICEWTSSSKPRILLHLIHHPNQEIDESVVDVTVLRETGILPAL